MLHHILFLLILSLPLTAATDIAIVAKVMGKCSWSTTATAPFTPLSAGKMIPSESRIRTAADGFVTLIYLDDKSTVKIRPNCQIQLRGIARSGGLEKGVRIESGEGLFEVTKGQAARFKVETPTAVASVKGTSFLVAASPDSLSTAIYGFTGVVGVRSLDSLRAEVLVTEWTKALTDRAGGLIRDTISDIEKALLRRVIESFSSGDTTQHISHSLTLTADDGGTVSPDTTDAQDRLPQLITALPAEGFYFTRWERVSGFGIIENQLSAKSAVVLNGGDLSLRATFSKEVVMATLTAGLGGRLSSTGTIAITMKDATPIVATPLAGFHFLHWERSGDVHLSDSLQASTTARALKPRGNGTITALFERDSGAVTPDSAIITSTAQGGGVITSPATISVPQGRKVDLSARANPQYGFFQWKVVSGALLLNTPEKPDCSVVAEESGEVTALFRPLHPLQVELIGSDGSRRTVLLNIIDNQ